MPSVVIPCSLRRFLLLHSQIRQALGLVFSGCNNLMACGAIIGNGLAIGTSMATIGDRLKRSGGEPRRQDGARRFFRPPSA